MADFAVVTSIKVSVIMAVHNEPENFLSEAIQSILNQTIQSFELILCDDASNQNTALLLKQMAEKDSRISVVSNDKNEFAAKTRNKGISLAKGQYVAIMDADDYSYPKRLQVQHDFLEKHPEYGFVCNDVDIFDGKSVLPSQYHLKPSPQKEDFLWGMPFIHPTVMIRKSLLDLMGGYAVDKETRRTEDYDLFMRLYANGVRGYNLSDVLYRYYVNPEAMRRKRLYRYRIDEARIRARNFKLLGLWPIGIPYVIKPLLVGLIPHWIIWRLKSR